MEEVARHGGRSAAQAGFISQCGNVRMRIAHELRAEVDHLAATQPLGMDATPGPVPRLQNYDRGTLRPKMVVT